MQQSDRGATCTKRVPLNPSIYEGARNDPEESPLKNANHKIIGARNRTCAKDGARQACFEPMDPERPVMYGAVMYGRRVPFTFMSTDMDLGLVRYLRSDPSGPFAGSLDAWPSWMNTGSLTRKTLAPQVEGRWQEWGFQFSPKEPFMLKADWHTVHSWGGTCSVFAPRLGGITSMHRSPIRITAFLESFREVNKNCWCLLADALHKLGRDGCEDVKWLVNLLTDTLQSRGHFGAVEVQAGPAFEPRKMQSHKDGATGLLHMGLTLSGRRTLRIGTHETDDMDAIHPMVQRSLKPNSQQLFHQYREGSVWREDCWDPGGLKEFQMRAGSAYISSPFLFEHGVSYEGSRSCDERCIDRDPLLALMCRFGFLTESEALHVNELRNGAMLQVACVVSDTLHVAMRSGQLRLPSLSEVRQVETKISSGKGLPWQ